MAISFVHGSFSLPPKFYILPCVVDRCHPGHCTWFSWNWAAFKIAFLAQLVEKKKPISYCADVQSTLINDLK